MAFSHREKQDVWWQWMCHLPTVNLGQLGQVAR